MTHSLPLMKGKITLEEALTDENDILRALTYPDKRLDLYFYLHENRQLLQTLVALHLGVSEGICEVSADIKE